VAWLGVLLLILASVRGFVEAQADTPRSTLLEIAGVSLAVCAFGFWLGRRIGGREFRLEAGQALGQKNTTLTLYLALAHAGPLAALGPAFYVVWHNLWNTWQLARRPGR
jgi:BASS family bile acid:Na+ symporter